MGTLSHMRILAPSVSNATGIQKTFNRLIDDINGAAIDTPYIPAWDNGVPGDGTDQTIALQAIVDGLPVEGGVIALRGDVEITALNLQGKRNIRFIGMGGTGAGADQRTMLRTSAGAVGGRIIDARDSTAISFENMKMGATNTAFNARFLDFDVISTGSALMSLKDCVAGNKGTSASCFMWLYGATQGIFENVLFNGQGVHVQMQNAAGVGFCNVHKFISCNHSSQNGLYAIQGSGEGITFLGCNYEAGGDGIGRAVSTSTLQDVRGMSFIGCTFYDVTVAGGEWIEIPAGEAINVLGCRMGGVTPSAGSNYGISLGGALQGVRGICIMGNTFRFMTAAINFGGTIVGGTGVRSGVVAANNVFGGAGANASALFSGIAKAQRVLIIPNEIDDLQAGAYGRYLALPDIPSYANNAAAVVGGLTTGEMYKNTGNLSAVTVVN